MDSNVEQNILFAQPTLSVERQEVAGACVLGLQLSLPTLVDDMENRADIAFNGWPERLYVLSPEGKVVYQGGKGPYGFDLEELSQFLKTYLI